MVLENTKACIAEMAANRRFGTYAMRISYKGETASFFSPDADEDTLFDNASMGKVLITSTMILHAVGEGKLSLDDTLPKFFPDVPSASQGITIRMLLTHTSGIVRVPISGRTGDGGPDVVAEYILSQPLAYKPGTSHIYSCNGFVLLGYILEKTYGLRLDEIAKKYLFVPLGYTRSAFNIPFDTPNAAVCYRCKYPGKSMVDDENVYAMGGIAGNGASFSTLADMERFIKAVLRRDEVLYPRPLFDLAEQDYTPDFSAGRGLGYLMPDCRYPQTAGLFPKGSFGHCGHCGHSFFICRDPELYVILLTNATRYAAMKHDFKWYNYSETEAMRCRLHDAIRRDLF